MEVAAEREQARVHGSGGILTVMGWVKNRFAEEELYRSGLQSLWDQVRDAIGEAVAEFNEQMENPNAITHSPCMANGKYCIRVRKTADESTIEIQLNPKNRTLGISPKGHGHKEICVYRAADDRSSRLKFVLSGEEISAEAACIAALGEFLFTPPPHRSA